MSVQPIPEGYQTLTPYLMVENPDRLIAFLRESFGAEELFRMAGPNGILWHGELQVGTSRLMLSQATDQYPARPAGFHVYVEDVDAAYARALAAGAESVMAPADQFYGDRHGVVKDAEGNQWMIATHVEEVAPEELQRRAEVEMQRYAAMVDATPA